MIRFSAILVAAAIAVLVTGVLASNLALVYVSIVTSVLAAVLLAVGVLLRRDEIFGDAGRTRAVRQSARPIPGGAGAPVMVGGRAKISRPGERSADPAAPIANGDAGAEAGQGTKPGAWKAVRGKSAPDQADGAKAGSASPGPAKPVPGRAGGRIGGGYSGAHSSGRGRSTTAPPGRGRGATAPPTGTGARGPGGPGPGGSAAGDTGLWRDGTSASDLAGGPAGRPAGPVGPPAGSADLNGRPPVDQAGTPAQDRAGNSAPDRAGGPSDLAGSPPDRAGTSSAQASNGRPEPAGSPPHAGGAEDAPPAAPPGSPPASLVPGWPHGPVPYSAEHDDFWDRVSEELDASAQRGSTAPPWAATAGPRAMGAGRADAPADDAPADDAPADGAPADGAPADGAPADGAPADGAPADGAPADDAPADEAVRADDIWPGRGQAESRVGPFLEDQRWTAWAPARGDRADAAPSAGSAQEPADAGARDEEAGPARSPASSSDSVPDVEDEEEEEAAPSPWSIPLSFVGDLEDDDVWHAPAAGTAEDAEQPAAGDGMSADGHDDEDAADREGEPEREPDGDGARTATLGAGAVPPTGDDADATKSAGETAGTPARSGENGAEASPAREEVASPAREEVASPARMEPVAEGPADVKAPGEPDHADDAPVARPDSERDSSSSASGDPGPAASATSASLAGSDRQMVNDEVTIVPGVARYHRSVCILIRFLGGDDLETTTRRAAEADGCIPCRACEPDKPLSADRG